MLVYVRPSNEALLRARVPEAQDQRGCPSNPFYRGGSASKKNGLPAPSHSSEAARCASTGIVPATPYKGIVRCGLAWDKARLGALGLGG